MFFVFFFFVCFFWSPLVWFFLWLPEEVLALLFLLRRENGDFSILMKDILLRPIIDSSTGKPKNFTGNYNPHRLDEGIISK